ncbi:hypothetical protein FB451DRAFT_1185165 [Mycena latifolia]|nr:hypothetical protein FB451DRAFT_1185165 [Mycena latifolia]
MCESQWDTGASILAQYEGLEVAESKLLHSEIGLWDIYWGPAIFHIDVAVNFIYCIVCPNSHWLSPHMLPNVKTIRIVRIELRVEFEIALDCRSPHIHWLGLARRMACVTCHKPFCRAKWLVPACEDFLISELRVRRCISSAEISAVAQGKAWAWAWAACTKWLVPMQMAWIQARRLAPQLDASQTEPVTQPCPMFKPGQLVMLRDVHPASDSGVLWYPARFIQRHQRRRKQFNEYEFQRLACNDGTLFNSEDSNLPVDMLRACTRSRIFCSEVKEINLTAEQIGKIRLPLYMEPDDPEHENPALTAIFNAALPRVAQILAEFDDNHPVVRDFNEYFSTKKLVQRHREAGEWMKKLGLAITPELEAVLTEPQLTLLKDNELTHLKEPERHCRVMGVGSVLLQPLAIQTELGEPLNLNGDLVADNPTVELRCDVYLPNWPDLLEIKWLEHDCYPTREL